MKILITLLAILSISTLCYAESTIEVKTGYGYIKDKDGNIVSKSEIPVGFHSLPDGYTYVPVSNKEELDNVKVYIPPKTDEQLKQEAIQKEKDSILQQQAIDNLKAKGILDSNGNIKK